MHGTNRLGGNSLSDLLVFGKRTGAAAAALAKDDPETPHVSPYQVRRAEEELLEPLRRAVGEDPYRISEELQETMQTLVGIFRVESDLAEAEEKIAALHARWGDVRMTGGPAFNPGWDLVFELRNLLIVSEAITRSALQRKESRGAHSRLDYTDTDPGWGNKNSIVRRRLDGAMEITTTALPPMPDDLRALLGSAH